MKGFTRRGETTVAARFEAVEAAALVELTEELLERLRSTEEDPSLSRLFPDAYPDDAEASAEFRRFTLDSLTDGKIENARAVRKTLGSPGRSRVWVELDAPAVQCWLRTLTDLRLVLATQLGITHDGDTGFRGGLQNRQRALLYAWLGYVQESLVRTL